MSARAPASLTARIGILFAIVAGLTFAVVGAYLYHALAAQLESREDADLLEKIGHIRHLLQETPSAGAIHEDPHRFEDAVAGHQGLMLVLKAKDGAVLMRAQDGALADTNATTGPAGRLAVLAELSVTPAGSMPASTSVRGWDVAPDLPARVAAAWGLVGDGGTEQVMILMARTNKARSALLAQYRINVLAGMMAGAALAALLGYLVVRRGLLPVREIARQAQSITAQHLDKRLNQADAPAELQALIESFNAMLDRLHTSFQHLSQFAADLAHDMRTPVNNLMVQTQVALAQARSPEDYQGLLESNIEEYERLARMVENMLFLARADHANVVLNKQRMDGRAELQRIADYFEGVAADAEVRISVEVAQDASGAPITADPILFRRAVNNLVANAIRHTPRGGSIRLLADASALADRVSVVNTGAGIPPEHLPRLFDRFYRADPARSDSASSAGLGLAIVQSIAVLHGGHADAASRDDGTTTFRLIFPKIEE